MRTYARGGQVALYTVGELLLLSRLTGCCSLTVGS